MLMSNAIAVQTTESSTNKDSVKTFIEASEMQSPVKYTETRQSFPTRPQKVTYGTGLFCTQDVQVS
jgi:hypothetical protein